VLRVYIDKEDGGKRSIGIPAVRDRIVQQVLLSNMSPIFEKEFWIAVLRIAPEGLL